MQLVQQADSAISHSDWLMAERLLIRALDTEPDNQGNVMLISNLGMVRFYQGADSIAIKTLTQAVEMAPESHTVRSNRARVYAATGHQCEALDDYSYLIAADSTLSEPLLYHGIISMDMGDIETAGKDFHRLEQLAPDALDTHIALASYYTSIGAPTKAIAHYSRLIELSPDPLYYGERAVLYMMTGRLTEASADIADGLSLDPSDGMLYLYRAVYNKMCYRPDDMRHDVELAVKYGVDKARIKQLGLD